MLQLISCSLLLENIECVIGSHVTVVWFAIASTVSLCGLKQCIALYCIVVRPTICSQSSAATAVVGYRSLDTSRQLTARGRYVDLWRPLVNDCRPLIYGLVDRLKRLDSGRLRLRLRLLTGTGTNITPSTSVILLHAMMQYNHARDHDCRRFDYSAHGYHC